MENKLLIEFLSNYFYQKGYFDAQKEFNSQTPSMLSKAIQDCLKDYEFEIREQRKDNPHHHTNRLD